MIIFDLKLENEDAITKEQLDSFALNITDPSADTVNVSYTYIVDKGEEAQEYSSLEKIILSRWSDGVKTMSFCFCSRESSTRFIEIVGKCEKLPLFLQQTAQNRAMVFIHARHLSLEVCKEFKSLLMGYFRLRETCVDNILHQIALATQKQQRKTSILRGFKAALFYFRGEEDKKTVCEDINALARTLITQAKNFDKEEARDEYKVLLELGNIFLSFKLYDQAMMVFKQESSFSARENRLAQAQIADMYMTNKVSACLDPTVQSLDENPSPNYANLEEGYLAAHKADQPEQCAVIANLLCDFEKDKFRDTDFTGIDSNDNKITDAEQHTKIFAKACQIIRWQQEEIKRLSKQSTEIVGNPITNNYAYKAANNSIRHSMLISSGPHFRRPHT